MGYVTAKASGAIADFKTPISTDITSLKVNFKPKQNGSGTPSPNNVREIVGWDGVEGHHSGKNMGHIVGYSAMNTHFDNSMSVSLSTSNNYGTTINTTNFSLPDTKLIVTQTQSPNTTLFSAYQNGYFTVVVDNLIWGQIYNISFKIENIISNPLNASLENIKLLTPSGSTSSSNVVQNNKILFKNIKWQPYPNTNVDRRNFEIRNCGMSFTLSEFMVTPSDNEDINFEPYNGMTIPYSFTRLPSAYQEVEYIENTGTQYILTDFQFRKDLTDPIIEWRHMQRATPSGDNMLWGYNDSNGAVYLEYYSNDDKFYGGNGGKKFANLSANNNAKKNHVVTGRMTRTVLTMNGHDINCTGDYTNVETSNVMSIFAWTRYGELTGQYINKGCRIYYLRFYNGDTLLAEYIPCYRKSDNEIGVYDTVSEKFYSNSGTGTFIKGKEVSFGGNIDIINGELNCDWDYAEYDGSEDETWTASTIERFSIPFSNCNYIRTSNVNIFCNKLQSVTAASLGSSSEYVCWTNGTGSIGVRINSEIDTVEKLKTWLQSNPIKIVQKVTEINTIQLPITNQLQTLKGQNYAWSNADSVDVEYKLSETFDIQKAKRKIIMNQPHIQTITGGNRILFNSDMKSNLKQCKVSFLPQQSGSGSPSPTNIRTITGWTGVDVYFNDTKYDVDWTNDVGTVYGGYVDFVKGELVSEYHSVPYTDWTIYKQNNGYICYKTTQPDHLGNWYCNVISEYGSFSSSAMDKNIIQRHGSKLDATGTLYMALDENVDISTVQVIYKKATSTPTTYILTPQQMTILKNANTFYTNPINNIEIKSWTHKGLSETTDYLSNVTWTDYAYISSGGKATASATSASHYTTNAIQMEAGTYNLKGFSYYNGTDTTRFRIHKYNSSDNWTKQVTYDTIGNLSPVDMTFTLVEDSRIRISLAMDFNGTLTKTS